MNPEPKKYQPAQIVKELMREFRINANEHNKDSLRKKVEDVCRNTTVNIRDEKTNLWDKSAHEIRRSQGKGRIVHYFSYNEYITILKSDDLRNHILRNLCDTKTAEEYHEAEREAKRRNEEYKEYIENVDYAELAEQEEQDELTSRFISVTWEDVEKKKFEMMIEALFIKAYGGKIDMDRLMDDMAMSEVEDQWHHTAESILAQKRLTDVKNYIEEVNPYK